MNRKFLIIIILILSITFVLGCTTKTNGDSISSSNLEIKDIIKLDDQTQFIKIHDSKGEITCYVVTSTGSGRATSLQCYRDIELQRT